MTDKIHAPWTEAQIAALNACQRSGRMHPFTCGGEHELHQTLIAERDGWHCPDERCDYQQTWAHAFMADPEALSQLGAGMPLPVLSPISNTSGQPVSWNPAFAELAKVRQQLCATEDDLGRERQHTARLAQQLEAEMQRTEALRIELRMVNALQKADTVPVPRSAFEQLVRVSEHVSVGKTFAFHQEKPYPDATARLALGALGDAGLHPIPDPDGGICDPAPQAAKPVVDVSVGEAL